MTAELAVMNKKAVAIAADSAVTIDGDGTPKIFTSANKIFQLSKYQPVGVMIYQDSSFLGVPWDTIIKLYRDTLGNTKKDHLKSYAQDFLSFLETSDELFTEEQKEKYLKRRVVSCYNQIVNDIEVKIKDLLQKKRKEKDDKQISISEIDKITDSVIDEHYEIWKNAEEIDSIKDNAKKHEELKERYKDLIVKIKNILFDEYNITSAQSRKLTLIAYSLFTKFSDQYYSQYSGIVFAGYGDKEIFPSLVSYEIEGLILNILKYRKIEDTQITFSNRAAVFPFAQSEMVHTFMEGIEPSFMDSIIRDIANMLSDISDVAYSNVKELESKKKRLYSNKFQKDLLDSFKSGVGSIHDYSRKKFTNPIIDIVSTLPKPELASMAESLVNLTTLRRKISKQAETVGGPIDVAVISKGDGFIWIKRKHYFDKNLNHHFFDTYYDD